MDGQFLQGTNLSRAFGGINAVAGVDLRRGGAVELVRRIEHDRPELPVTVR